MEGFMEVFKNLEAYKEMGSFDGWVYTVMVRSAINHYRTERRFQKEVQTEELETYVAVSEEETILTPLEAKQVLAFLEQIPVTERTVFNMKAIDGFSFEEIAKALGKKQNAVRVAFMRARNRLMAMIGGNNIK